ncbi:MAG: stage III sporulation protein AE [Candidatus Cellulosilyticum pullistercoris]|uniref:Stage III sporulation protein AE n=1 Tax=Candidatus Cellulosilyticum pullistercoris TaxID=2838521 RepID=A0A9E2KDU6_9FIRM|nr:stage III sporulation protein AE [Candidatus Cellulosilyticum pullistercoris]
MKLKKIGWYCFIIVICFLLSSITLKAENLVEKESPIGNLEEEQENEIIHYGLNLLDWESIEQLEEELQDAMPNDISFHLKEEMGKLLSGQNELSVTSILTYIVRSLFNEAGIFIKFGARFVLIVLLCNLLQALSSSFKSKDTAKIGFFVCYMVILLSVVQSFEVMIRLAIEVIEHMTQVMLICIPILLAFMATSGFNISAGTMAPVIVTSLSLMSYFMKIIVLPCIISVVVLEIMSVMSEEFKVNKLVGLFYKGIKWVMRSILLVSVSLLGFYRLVMPGVDLTVKKATVKFSTAFIPVVGNAVGGTIDFITQGSMLIRNTFSAGIIMWLLILVSIPLIKIFAYVCVYQIAGAIIEPIGDKRMATIATKLGKGCQFIMSSVGIIALFCICSLVICMTISASGV